MSKFTVILPAAGRSQRFGDKNYKKPFAPLADRAVWLHTVERFASRKDVCQTILVIAEEDREAFNAKFGANLAFMEIDVAIGGNERTDSVAAALEKVSDQAEYIAIHDAARPCVEDKSIDAVFAAAEKSGAAILATQVASTLKRAEGSGKTPAIAETVSRDGLWAAQTPQVFARQLIEQAYANRGSEPATDDAQLVERLGHQVTLVPDSPLNIKITTRRDLRLAELILKTAAPKKPDGIAHPFAGDDLWR
ncbi:2-C-methyl-D-erythritol 4-phosphate cytidylyltransferase [Aeoliella mucimassa]|uniref:2-C-methyl-D-erythritol 4-phosphate cytidylyltransferase n=1 Tax=Aeoliella mucimassa TaxID=2527972 RepID=A0A518ARW9_9BACT|nr:2-C-methyl-D-erythritol 4-phosphate cytidylyltransferase [Aeoliella mucimassa]QDU57462.1 2-C-methyl-D-erythritol 4-phosphate cytidylyltransferase [Aeoliella mucimassa]